MVGTQRMQHRPGPAEPVTLPPGCVFKVQANGDREVGRIIEIAEQLGYEHTLTDGWVVWFRIPLNERW